MELIVAIDNLVLSFFTKISHIFYRLTGCTNFFLAKLSVCILTASVMTNIVGFWFPILDHKPSPFIVVIGALICLGSLFYMYLCDKADGAIFSDKRVKFSGSFGSLDSPAWRFLWIVLTAISIPIFVDKIFFKHEGILIFKILDRAFLPAFTSFHYFISVDPPTPGKSKIKKWIEAFSAGFQKLAPIKARN